MIYKPQQMATANSGVRGSLTMELDKEEFARIFSIFKEECGEHIQKLNEGFLLLEKEPNQPSLLSELFRHSHSIKGSARMMGFTSIEKMAHVMETMLGKIQEGEIEVAKEVIDTLYKGVDSLAKAVESLNQGKSEQEINNEETIECLAAPEQEEELPPGDSASPRSETEEELPPERRKINLDLEKETMPAGRRKADVSMYETVRVATKKLDNLMNQVGELLITKIKVDQRLQEVRELIDFSEECQRELQQDQKIVITPGEQISESTVASYKNLLQKAHENTVQMDNKLNLFYQSLSEDRNQMSLVTDELQKDIKKARMLPFHTAVEVMPRMVRDLAQEEGKNVRLEIEGGEVELDKNILEKIKDPLIHLIRNAVDHGIEPPEERKKKGKPLEGVIALRALQQGDSIIVDIEDDGNGIQTELIKEVALKRKFLTATQLEKMTEHQVLDIIFQPGFSTSKILTDVSGRGVGMDVVRNNIESLKGIIKVNSTPGEGTVFTVKLPLTMVTLQTLKVQVKEEIFSIPTPAVETTLEISPEQIFTIEGQEAISYNNRPIPVVRMEEILDFSFDEESAEGDGKRPAVVLGSAEKQVAFLVNKLLGEDVVVAKALGSHLERVRNISGATILGNGEVSLILNISDLVESAQHKTLKKRGARLPETQEDKKNTVLVIEDSITTRTLEISILESAGYQVVAATDGQDGYSKLVKEEFDVIVTDVQMPNMDGFSFTRKVKSNLKYQHIPVILLTSLESPEEKKQGIEVGADAYIIKSAFDQNSLLDTIKRLL
jgi:two-component system chemotaxis sensor kinase CheA